MIPARTHNHPPPMSPARSGNTRMGGFSLLELMVALSMLGSVMATIVPVLTWVNAQRRASAARQVAVQEAKNILERLTADDWGDITQQRADAVTISAEANNWMRDPQLTVTVTAVQQQPVGKRVAVELRWKNREGDEVSPVRLTSFVFHKVSAP